tara:strand:- start:15 stop:734 length:720 start_codon:yes stop_codon:yes gene_type:complete
MIKSSLFILFQALSVTIWGILVLITAPFFSISQRYSFTMLWPKMNIFIAKYLLGIKYEINGYSNIKILQNNPAIICSKHQSAWETFFLANGLKKHVCFVFKQELLLIPFFGWGIKLLEMIHINRKAGKKSLEQIIDGAPKQFKLNRWIVFFPEGTRTLPGEKKHYKIGAAVLSSRLNIPIVPIAHNSGFYWKKNAWIKKPGTIILKIGPAIFPGNKTPENIINEVHSWIENNSKTRENL